MACPMLLLTGSRPHPPPTIEELQISLASIEVPFTIHYKPPPVPQENFCAALRFDSPSTAAGVLAALRDDGLKLGHLDRCALPLSLNLPKAKTKTKQKKSRRKKRPLQAATVPVPVPQLCISSLLLSQAESLDLRRCDVPRDTLQALVSALERGSLQSLTSVRLPQDQDDPLFRRLAGIVAVQYLQRIGGSGEALRSLSRRCLGDEGAVCVAAHLSQETLLRSLGVHHNGIGKVGAAALASAIAHNNSLTELALFCNKPGSFWGTILADALRSNTVLTSLDLGGLKLGDAGVTALSQALSPVNAGDGSECHNTTLRDLHLDYCDIGPLGGESLLSMVKLHPAMVNLWVHGNPDMGPTIEHALATAVEVNAASTRAAAATSTEDKWPAMLMRGRMAALALQKDDAFASYVVCGLSESSALADRIAALGLAAYRKWCAAHAASARGQTVIAAFVVAVPKHGGDGSATSCSEDDHAFHTVALGVGTKFLAPAIATSAAAMRGELVRDSHAEVLAHRSLRRFFHAQAALALGHHASLPSDGIAVETASPVVQLAMHGSSPSGTSGEKRPKFTLRPGVRLFLYTSTAPCGAASAGGDGSGFYVKRVGCDDGKVDTAGSAKSSAPRPANSAGGCARVPSEEFCAGCPARRRSCSDKVARWVAGGLLGRGFGALLSEPAASSWRAIVVGRKLNVARCERALCGDSRAEVLLPSQKRPAVLGSALRVEAAGGAGDLCCGDSDESWSWALGDAAANRHDGRTGRPLDTAWGTLSSICSVAMKEELAALHSRLEVR